MLPELPLSHADMDTFRLRIRWTDRNDAIQEFNPGPTVLPNYTLPHQSTFFRRSTVLNHDGYDEAFQVAGDRDLILRLHRSGASISHHPQLIADFYSGGVSSSAATGFEYLWIDVRQGRRPLVRLLLSWVRRPPGPGVGRFFSLAGQHLIGKMRPRRRLGIPQP